MTQCGCMGEKSQCCQKLWFRHLSVIIFKGRTFTGARGAHKRHKGVYLFISPSPKFMSTISETMIRHKSRVLLFLHVTPSNPRPYHC